MKAKTIKETLNEVGAGYAVWGGGSRGGFGNPTQGGITGGRGFGFGSSNNSGGPNMMYTYTIMPLNKSLEPAASMTIDEPTIHQGSIIKGTVLGKDSHVIGQVLRVEKDHDGNIKYYQVLDPETSTKVNIDPTSAYNWVPEPEGGTVIGQDFSEDENGDDEDTHGDNDNNSSANEGMMLELQNFERTQNSKRSMGIGWEDEIIGEIFHNISNDYQLDPSDKDYLGFLNVDGKDFEDSAKIRAYRKFINNFDDYTNLLHKFNLDVEERPSWDETVFINLT